MASSSIRHGRAQNLSTNVFVREGHSFEGWARLPDGEVEFTDRQSVANLTTTAGATVRVYAIWRAHTFTVVYNGNGGSGSMPPSIFTYDVANYLQANTFTHLPEIFIGWARYPLGDVEFPDRENVVNLTAEDGGIVTLYAQWGSSTPTVAFDANGGTGTAPYPQTVNAGSSITIPGAGELVKDGHTFGGWNTRADGMGTSFSIGATFMPLRNITLYAVWDANTITVPGDTLAAQLSWLHDSARNGNVYIVEITGNESVAPQTLSFAGRNDVTVILRGRGAMRTLGLSTNGNLFTVGAGVTLVLDMNLTLNGRSGNNRALVEVNDGGTLTMNAGARIAGNINTTTSPLTEGGGVRINSGGRFNMRGGEIATNTGCCGGGVHNAGDFRISGGLIHGSSAALGFRNTATNNGAALFNSGTAWHGTFNAAGAFTQAGGLDTTNDTINVANGVLQP